MFYPIIKAYISPSALDSWHHSRGQFVRSYFEGIKSPETSSMRVGKQIHAMAEGGILDVKKRYEHSEVTLTTNLEYEFGDVKVLGIPDSHESKPTKGNVNFVDYKSGKDNTWDEKKLATDLKMKTTAWLVWRNAWTDGGERPKTVTGYIEYIPTRWDFTVRELVPTYEKTTVSAKYVYKSEELEAFEQVIRKTITDVNTAYDEWIESTDEFIDRDDVARYAQLTEQAKKIAEEMSDIKDRLTIQMQTGSKKSYSSVVGTFYFTERKKWEYPEELVKAKDKVAIKMKKFEQENDPVGVSSSLAFRGI